MVDPCWLPDTIPYNSNENWGDYEDALYSIFEYDFIKSQPRFKGKQVQIRRHPVELGREEAFWHVTCRDFSKDGDRKPDLRRCERIKWVRAFIENYDCKKSCGNDCDGLYIWATQYKNKTRFKILFKDEMYVVIIEEREKYCLLITAFYIDNENRLEKMLKEYYRVMKQEAPH